MSQYSASKTILLVEDEALFAMCTTSILEENGYNVVHVLDGAAAIKAVEAGGIDLILMDIDLGRNKMDGTEAAERILEKHSIPVIFHTSHSEKEMVDKVKGITRYGYVLKNAGEFVLLESIQMAFELYNANRQIIEKEERYKYMFEYSRSCVAVLKAVDDGNDFVFIDYNQTAEETDKIWKDEVIGNRVTVVFPGVEEFGLLDVFRTVWRTGGTMTHSNAFYQDDRISGWRESIVYKVPSGEIVSVYQDVTEEKETQEKLQQSEENYHSLVESINEGIWSIDENSCTTYVNPRMADMLGYRVEEMIGKHLFDFMDDGAQIEAERQLTRRKSGKTDQHRFTFRTKDGTEVHTIVGTTPIINEKGVYSGASAVVMDITHLLEVETELKEHQENYRNILESIGDAVISTDIQGNITQTNHVAREMIGCSEEDIRNKPLYDVFTLYNSQYGKQVPNPVETVLHTDKNLTLSNHTKLISRNGKELHIADSVAPVHDAKGETQGAVLVFRDETEKYERERRLRESEEQYRRLFENMAEGFIRTDAEDTIILVNQAAVELCGYDSIDDLGGRRMADLYADPGARKGLLKKLEEEKQFRNHEFLLKQKNGSFLWTLSNIKIVLDEDGNYAGTEGLFRDYTDKKAVELERERSERFLDSILDAIQDPVSVHDADLNVRKANQVVHAMFSNRSNIEGGKCYKVYYDRNTPCEECPTLKAFITKKTQSCLKEISENVPSKQYFELFAYPIIDAKGAVESVVEYARDITDLVEREQELQKSNNRFQALFNNTSVMLVIDPETGEIQHANASALNFYGYSYKEITSMRIQDINVLSTEEVKEEMAAAAAEKKIYFNFRHRLASAEVRDVEVYSGKVKWGEKDVLCSVIHDVTEKKQTEGKLRESERRFRAVFEQAAAGIAVAALDGRILEVNEKLCRILGYSKEELTRLNVEDISAAEDLIEEKNKISAVVEGKSDFFNIEKRYIHKDGKIIWVNLSSQVVRDKTGNIDFVIGVVVDITDLKAAQIKLKENLEILNNITDNMFDMVAFTNVEGEFLYVSPSHEKLVGYSPEFLKGRNMIEFVHPDDLEGTLAAISALKETKSIVKHELRYRKNGGDYIWIEAIGKAQKNESSQITGMIISSRDITERKEVEERLNISDTYYKNVLRFIPVFVLDRDYRYLHVNDLASGLVHIKPEALIGKRITDIFPGFEETDFFAAYEKVMKTNTTDSITASFSLPDGTIGHYQVNILPCPEGIQCIAIDITEEKKAEEALQKALDESEKLRQVVQNSPVCAFTWRNEKGWPVEYVSENVDLLLGFKAEDFISERVVYGQLMHPDDLPRIENEVRGNLSTGKSENTHEYRVIDIYGSLRWVEEQTSAELDEVGNPVLLHGLVWDITHRKEAELNVEKQREYEKAVAKVSTSLLTAQSESEALQEALTRLRKVSKVSRIYIFENFTDPDNGLCMRQTYEVCASDVSPEIDNSVLQHVVYNNGFSRWRELLSSGNAVWGNVKDFPNEERNVLEPQGIVSMLVLPLFIRGEWRGFVGFDNTNSAYRWSRSESLLLQTACDLIGGFLGRMESEKAINKQLQEKELLIRETHHRIKNNITSIYGLLHLQAETVENEEARSILNEAVGRVNSMRDLYDKMLSSEDIRIVSAAPYLNDLVDSIIKLFSHQTAITVEKNISDFTLDSDKLFSLGIIVNELLTNAMKYAFPGQDTGIIRVNCEKPENKVSLVVHDDGIGFPDGFDIEQSPGLGMMFVNMLCKHLDGTVNFENNNGTRVTIEFNV